ncbi:MAG: metal-dependent transcriptional regulator [Planctomycetota bacterium]
MPSRTVEDYLKRLLLEEQVAEGDLVPMGRLAAVAGVTPGTATAMVKTLAEAKLLIYEPRVGVRLTSRGRKIAVQVLRRHRLLELFLVETLGLKWSEVHEEAEVLEHAISDRVLNRIDELLGHPTVDPHGDPIPTSAGKVALPRLQSLAECGSGRFEVARLADQDPQFLEFAAKRGLVPGARLQVKDRDPLADLVTVQAPRRKPATIGLAAARKVLVAPYRGGRKRRA